MNLYLFDEERIIIFTLPVKKIGNFWLKDDKDRNLVNISAQNNSWYLKPSKITKIYDSNNNTENLMLQNKTFYLVEKDEKKYILYSDYLSDNSFKNYTAQDKMTIKVGKSTSNQVCIPLSCVNDEHLELSYVNKKWTIKLLNNSVAYINGRRIRNQVINCNFGDVVNIYGVKLLLVCGYVFINNPFNNLIINGLEHIDLLVEDDITDEEIENEDMYADDDYFLKSPRIMKNIVTYEMKIDSPPAKDNTQDPPLWITLGPMLTMAASSLITLSNSLSYYISGERTFTQILPSLIICLSMVCTMLIWPFITKKFQKKQREKKEEERQNLYQEYINKKDKELSIEYENQKRTLEETIISTDICYDMIINKRRTLWARRSDQIDFLKLRVGRGDIKFDSNIIYQSEDFTMDNDNLKEMLNKLINFNKVISDVPMSYSFADNPLTGINGVYPKYITFTNNLILQMMAFHSYDNLKIVVFTNKLHAHRWDYLKETPYCFSNDKQIRYFATNVDEMQEVSEYILQIFNSRKILNKNGNGNERISDYSRFEEGYFFILIDDIDVARKIDLINDILKEKGCNLGFSIVILEEKLSKVPSEISKFIIIGEKTSVILDTTNNNQTKFIEETNDNYDMYACSKVVANMPLRMKDAEKQLPNSVSFLELFGVGKIEQLNVLNRYKENNPTKSLKAQVGINTIGEPFMLDLHEKQHGPHGLVAGMTGSGKSEFIITYILSMAINYSPEEVAFVLIDYKGGGLAGAFVDSETGKKLPHVVGTITNLDKTEINRALASINSELQRRQKIFNEVRLKTGEGTIDIYKYQRLYRDGVINEPIPHLIIVSDEFAELKDQQPEFMDDLVSTARIGRSLGVHLILATQKPSGVVDGQIWSNSKFKVCLKVQDKQDSMEMIKNDLAAELKNVGRFYLLVGYNEYFAMGQAAWAGAQYYPNDEYKKPVDKNLYFIDNVGSISKTINNIFSKTNIVAKGEELTNIVKYLITIGEETNFKINQLWLDRVPNQIYIDELTSKYNYQPEKFKINPIIGEYDNPSNQTQGLFTLDFNNMGNTVIYGTNESGKDELLQTIIYSLIKNYSSEELNLYISDFGSETLTTFKNAPQVGDVVINGEDEKVSNFYKLLLFEMNKRKKLFTEFGGSYNSYIKNSGKTLPTIIAIINSVEIMNELYMDCIENFIQIIREGNKYGMYFIFTTDNQNTIKMKVTQSCKNFICLQMNNEQSYRDILGKTANIIPSPNLGRGLMKKDIVCEFQTAFITKDETSYNAIKQLVNELNTKGYKKAQPIHVMPDKIEISRFKDKYLGLDSVPIGIASETLNSMLYDFKKKCCNIISASEIENASLFINNVTKVLSMNNNSFGVSVVDAVNYFEKFEYQINYINKDYNKLIDSINNINENIQKVLIDNDMNFRTIENVKNTLIMVIGFEKFFNKLDDEHKTKFKKILTDNKEYAKINFIFIDIPISFKKYEFDEWYKSNFDGNNGIWIGGGLYQQFVLKTSIQRTSLGNIDNTRAIVIKNGLPIEVKLINEVK
ncbi:MAG: type VII secretion protein EssC [Bacilli bacterium]